MSLRSNRKALLALALLIAGAPLLLQSVATPAIGDPPEDPPPAASFAVLSEGDEPSPELIEMVGAEWIEGFELDLEAARSAEASSSTEVAVVPGTEGVCIVSETVITCSTWLDAELGGLAVVEACSPGLDPGEIRVTGLVPDPAAAAAITRPPSAAVAVSAPLNVYSETFSGDPAELVSSGLPAPAVLAWDPDDESLTTCMVPAGEKLEGADED